MPSAPGTTHHTMGSAHDSCRCGQLRVLWCMSHKQTNPLTNPYSQFEEILKKVFHHAAKQIKHSNVYLQFNKKTLALAVSLE